jgi:hypothetical protein
MDDDDRRPVPTWVWLVAAVLLVALAVSVVGWVLKAVFALLRVVVFLALVGVAFFMLRAAFGRRR